MEEYTRDSLRELRKNQVEEQRKIRKNRGSIFITMLIILLFLAAGLFVFMTISERSIGKAFSPIAIIEGWKEDITAAFSPKEDENIRATVDQALNDRK
jgi:hypothetical protein